MNLITTTAQTADTPAIPLIPRTIRRTPRPTVRRIYQETLATTRSPHQYEPLRVEAASTQDPSDVLGLESYMLGIAQAQTRLQAFAEQAKALANAYRVH